MRDSLFITCTLLIAFVNSYAQAPEIIRIKGKDIPDFIQKEKYRYPAFMKARVYFNNGDSAGGMLNYNNLLQSMQFIDHNNDTLVIADEKNVNYIKIGADTFFYDNGYYELIGSFVTAKLVFKYSLKSGVPQKIGAFGFAAPTADIETWTVMRGFSNQKLDLNEEYVFTKQKIFYISGIKKRFIEANSKNISRLFPKKDVDNYIKENKT